MKKTLIAAIAIATASLANAQEPDWSVPVDGAAKKIYFDFRTQTPILETADKFLGFSPESKSCAWTIIKSEHESYMKRSQAFLSSDELKDRATELFEELDGSHYAKLNNLIIDAASGEVVLGDNASPFNHLEEYYAVPEINAMLLIVKTDKEFLLYAIDIKSNKQLWKLKLDDVPKGKEYKLLMKDEEHAAIFKMKMMQPLIADNGNLILGYRKKLYQVDSKSGAIIWENPCVPAKFVLSPDKKNIFYVEKAENVDAIDGLSRMVGLIDTQSGKALWAEPLKLNGYFVDVRFQGDDKMLISSQLEVMQYRQSTGEKLWKKPFGGDFIYDLVDSPDGIMVYFGAKYMLINPETGIAQWKSPQEIRDIDETAGMFAAVYRRDYDKSRLIFTPRRLVIYDKEKLYGAPKISIPLVETDLVGFDDKNHKLILLNGKKLMIIDPDNDLKRPDAISIKIENPSEMLAFNVLDDGYFIYGLREYMRISGGNVASSTTFPQLKANRQERTLTLVLDLAKSIAAAGNSSENVFCTAPTAFSNQKNAKYCQEFYSKFQDNSKCKPIARVNQNNCVFLTTASQGGKESASLAIIDKNSGKETSRIALGNGSVSAYAIDMNSNTVYYVSDGKFCAVTIK